MFDWAPNTPLRFAKKTKMFMKTIKYKSRQAEGILETAVLKYFIKFLKNSAKEFPVEIFLKNFETYLEQLFCRKL